MAPAKLLMFVLVIWIAIFLVIFMFQRYASKDRKSIGDRRRKILARMRDNSSKI